jgi:chromatin structure-remodeling complex subunit RSC9
MHESFGYSSDAQVMQVTFWQAYRDFFSHKNVTEQLLSASEVIKNVQIAFPAAQPKMWTDERGESKFVIAGIGFRKGGSE